MPRSARSTSSPGRRRRAERPCAASGCARAVSGARCFAHQLEERALEVGVGDHDRRVDLAAACGSSCPATTPATRPSRRGSRCTGLCVRTSPPYARIASMRRRGDHLPAALRVVGAAQEVVGDARRHHHRRLRGAHRVAALLAEQHAGGPLRELVLGEELGHRPQPPLQEDRRLRPRCRPWPARPGRAVAGLRRRPCITSSTASSLRARRGRSRAAARGSGPSRTGCGR